MPKLDEFYEYRERLLEHLRMDFVGPLSDDEVLDDEPVTRYAAGILFPQGAGTVAAEQDVDIQEGDDEATFGDPPVALANARYPSSMGFTFAVDTSLVDTITVEVKAARYEPLDSEGTTAWARKPLEVEPIDVSLEPRTDPIRVADGLELYVRVRQPDEDGTVPVTLVLVNRLKAERYPRDPDCFFQPNIEVLGADAYGCFVERRGGAQLAGDAELESYRLLYRHARTFAVGHGCATEWEATDDDRRCTRIWTSLIPAYPLRVAQSNPSIQLEVLRMATIADGDREGVLAGLVELCDGYSGWIEDRRIELAQLTRELQTIGEKHLQECDVALERMRGGIALLRDDRFAWDAFRLANKAMQYQRARSTWHASGRPGDEPDLTADYRWRAFQLAFILLCLVGVTRDEHPDRELADLLWFPTGGGKTEAYLGLIAFTVFLRRLRQGDAAGGTAVIMRYTLRLLTIQQFERAALLMCCLEAVREEDARLGEEPFRIGLWVGRRGTPNTLQDAAKAIQQLRDDKEVLEQNPVQLHSCPWCGARLTAWDYWDDKRRGHMRVQCSSRKKSPRACKFAEDLPVLVVDEDLYRHPPSLVIATADKFATLPWKAETGRLFGIGTPSRPPELIIQDELHLISGPLGTLVGLYETAVDILCSREGRGPKIIASTATIRRAQRQTRALFAREMRQFPPPGIDARSSYFAVEAQSDKAPTRLYVGVMAPAVSNTTAMVRTYARLLQSVEELDAPPEIKDPYWTLVGYFNSLRVLGGARMQVQDDVSDRLELLAGEGRPRDIDERIELTSRESSADIPQRLAHMNVRHPDDQALDVILATNMISVGVDIDRLGLMVVMGQPQSTSEYIQSTSRIGRLHPGMVVTLYNGTRSRDRSHYEAFRGYHAALYRQVESTSVTPFSSRARDRGLHAVLIALARLTLPGLADNSGAANVNAHQEALQVLKEKILERVAHVSEEELEPARAQLDDIISRWTKRADTNGNLVFQQPFKLDMALLADAAKAKAEDGHFPTLWSLRDVDAESNLDPVR